MISKNATTSRDSRVAIRGPTRIALFPIRQWRMRENFFDNGSSRLMSRNLKVFQNCEIPNIVVDICRYDMYLVGTIYYYF
jgi:hypothetical protein